jgi:hypothetical protein
MTVKDEDDSLRLVHTLTADEARLQVENEGGVITNIIQIPAAAAKALVESPKAEITHFTIEPPAAKAQASTVATADTAHWVQSGVAQKRSKNL